ASAPSRTPRPRPTCRSGWREPGSRAGLPFVSLLDLWEGDTPAAWAARWAVPRLEAHGRIGSTNDRARELAEAGAEPFTVVLTEAQSAGRGRDGRRWESPAGAGLWMSVVAPARPPADRP